MWISDLEVAISMVEERIFYSSDFGDAIFYANIQTYRPTRCSNHYPPRCSIHYTFLSEIYFRGGIIIKPFAMANGKLNLMMIRRLFLFHDSSLHVF